MSTRRREMTIAGLRWAVGVVVIAESLRLALHPAAAQHFARAGMPLWMRPALAWTELVAAILFLVPLTTVAGGYLLLVIFLLAALLHVLHGEFAIGALVVYGLAVLVSMAHRAAPEPEGAHDRP